MIAIIDLRISAFIEVLIASLAFLMLISLGGAFGNNAKEIVRFVGAIELIRLVSA